MTVDKGRKPVAASATTAARTMTTTNYFARVAELLTPLDSDSARIDAIATDAALHTELVLMAEDSLTWGSHAARTALNLYAGANYTIWYADAAALELDSAASIANRLVAPATSAAALTLAPNPSDGHVTVSYSLPANNGNAVLVIYDAWGTKVAQRPISIKAAQAEIQLMLREGFYHAALVVDGVIIAKDRLFIESR